MDINLLKGSRNSCQSPAAGITFKKSLGLMFLFLLFIFFSCSAFAEPDPSLPELFSALYYAYSCFCSVEQLEKWDCMWCTHNPNFQLTGVLYNQTTETLGVVGYDESMEKVVVAFRGSFNIENWILDLKPKRTKSFYNTTIHEGWFEGFEALKDQMYVAIEKALTACPYCSKKLVFSGHSLGSAISQVAAVDAAMQVRHSFESIQCLNFGCPRVGLQNFADLFEKKVDIGYRVVHYAGDSFLFFFFFLRRV